MLHVSNYYKTYQCGTDFVAVCYLTPGKCKILSSSAHYFVGLGIYLPWLQHYLVYTISHILCYCTVTSYETLITVML